MTSTLTPPKIIMPKKSVKERQQQVLEVLIGLLNADNGLQRVTTKRLAEAVGVSEGALYRYFPSKKEMYEALFSNIEAALTSHINQVTRKETSTEARVKGILYTFLDFIGKNPGVARILSGHALMFEDESLKQPVNKFFDALEFQLANILQMSKLREGKTFACGERALANFLINFCEGQCARLVRSNFRYDQNRNFDVQWSLIKPIFE